MKKLCIFDMYLSCISLSLSLCLYLFATVSLSLSLSLPPSLVCVGVTETRTCIQRESVTLLCSVLCNIRRFRVALSLRACAKAIAPLGPRIASAVNVKLRVCACVTHLSGSSQGSPLFLFLSG